MFIENIDAKLDALSRSENAPFWYLRLSDFRIASVNKCRSAIAEYESCFDAADFFAAPVASFDDDDAPPTSWLATSGRSELTCCCSRCRCRRGGDARQTSQSQARLKWIEFAEHDAAKNARAAAAKFVAPASQPASLRHQRQQTRAWLPAQLATELRW